MIGNDRLDGLQVRLRLDEGADCFAIGRHNTEQNNENCT